MPDYSLQFQVVDAHYPELHTVGVWDSAVCRKEVVKPQYQSRVFFLALPLRARSLGHRKRGWKERGRKSAAAQEEAPALRGELRGELRPDRKLFSL
jgi:hypothetical protein